MLPLPIDPLSPSPATPTPAASHPFPSLRYLNPSPSVPTSSSLSTPIMQSHRLTGVCLYFLSPVPPDDKSLPHEMSRNCHKIRSPRSRCPFEEERKKPSIGAEESANYVAASRGDVSSRTNISHVHWNFRARCFSNENAHRAIASRSRTPSVSLPLPSQCRRRRERRRRLSHIHCNAW